MGKARETTDLILEITLRICLWSLFVWLDRQVPVIRHIDEDELWNYRYPSYTSIISKKTLYIIMTTIPFTILFVQYLLNRKDNNTIASICSAIKGLTLAYCVNGIFTAALKLSVGRPRPNFFLRCFPDGYGTNIDECNGEYNGMMDGRKSFPSGHASFAFTGMIYLMLHLYKNLELRKPRAGKGAIIVGLSMFPLLASLIGASRTADYHHHFTDVLAGAVLGTIIAISIHYLYSEIEKNEEIKT